MKKKYELKVLKELSSIGEDPNTVSKRCGKAGFGYSLCGWIILFLVLIFAYNGMINSVLGTFCGLVSGVLIGLGIHYNSAKLQIPLLQKYCPPMQDEIKNRIAELRT